jgi:UDP-glucose 4-epimerase
VNILITGAAGFIGSHLFKHLKGLGHNVVGIDNMSHPCKQEVPVDYVDVRSYKDLLPYFQECDVVFHLAAQISVDKSIYNPEETIATNVLGTQNILELARKYGVKVVFASSSEVYGSAVRDFMGEDHPLNAHSPYGATKLAGDRLCEAYVRTYRMDIATVRNFNTFGEYQSDDSYGGVIAKFVKAALDDKPLVIYGDGEQERDYMHVSDTLQAYTLALKEPSLFNCAINFGTGKTVKIIDLANKIIEMIGSRSEIEYMLPRKGEVFRLCADIEMARSLGFKPKTNFWKDLGRYIEWVKGKE